MTELKADVVPLLRKIRRRDAMHGAGVDVASARLWLLEGIRIDDVITMLEVRRRFEFPSHVCTTRAREIATTARRMIARSKTA